LVLGLGGTAGAWTDIDDPNYNLSFEYDVNFDVYQCHGLGDLTYTLAWNDNEVNFANVEIDCPNSLLGENTPECGCKNDPATKGIIKLTMGQWGTDSNLLAWQTLDPCIDSNTIIKQDHEYRIFFDTFKWQNPDLFVYLYYGDIPDNNYLDPDVNVINWAEITASTVYQQFELSFIAEGGQPYIGEPLGIRFMEQGQGWYWIDDVRVQFRSLTKAREPEPENGALGLPKSGNTLRWVVGSYVADNVSSHEVYFGTDMTAVADANTNTAGIYRGNASGGPDANDKYYYNLADTLPLGQRCYWRVDEVNESYAGPNPPPGGRWKGDVWTFRIIGTALNPNPADDALGVPVYTDLGWTAGTGSEKHDVYFGTDATAVANATTSSSEYMAPRQDPNVFANGSLSPAPELATTYYWRIDEVNETGGTIIDGDVWSFTTAEYTIVDEFDSYVDDDELLAVWDDYWTNFTGAEVFVDQDANFTEDANAMQYKYDSASSPYYSEAWATMTDLGISGDWTTGGVEALRLAFRGDYDNAIEDMYVALLDGSGRTGKVLYDGDPNNLNREWLGFQEWNIELQEFVDDNSVDLTDVQRITLGLGDKSAGGSGFVWFDNIRLHAPRCVPEFAPSMGSFRYLDHHAGAGSFEADCSVDIYDVWTLSRDWLISGIGDVTAASASTTGIVGHWTLDDAVGSGAAIEKARVLDSSGLLNHAYLYDGFTPASLPKYGNTKTSHTADCMEGTGALTFDGVDDWITIPNAPNLDSNTITVSAWVKPGSWQGMWGTYPPIVASNEPNGFKLSLGSKATYETGQEWTPNNELTYFWTGWSWDYHSGLIVAPDLWSFVALVVEPTKGTLYCYDGMKMSTSTNYEAHVAKPFDNACFIGNDDVNTIDETVNCFGGLIDDVYFYGRALATAEILDLAGLSGTHNLGLEAWRPDADGDDTVNFDDYGVMADNWLKDVLWP
jgi:hypothetical protein